MNLRLNHRCSPLLLLTISVTFVFTQPLAAHFIWVNVEGGKHKIVFGEDLDPGEAKFLDRLENLKAWDVTGNQAQSLSFQTRTNGNQGWLELSAAEAITAIDASCMCGILKRGDKTILLHYDAKYLRAQVPSTNPVSTSEVQVESELRLNLVPHFKGGNLTLTATLDGNPVSNVEVSIKSVEANQQTMLTDESGKATIRPTSRTVILAKHTVDQAGEYQGQTYSEQRFYCTLVLDADSADTQTDPTVSQTRQDEVSLRQLETLIPPIPLGVTSFGASRIGQRIYLVGGKSGKAHDYARDYQNQRVFQFDLKDTEAGWQPVADNLGLQGLASVAYQSKLIRLGGLEARNKPGEDHDLHSLSDVVAFDVNEKQWSKLPSLPAGRSSFDACRLGDQIFVVGGWSMAGKAEPTWATDLLMIDLKADKPEWIAVKAPFEKRALAVGSFKNQIVVVGGIDRNGSPSDSVHLFDPQRRTWSQGPALPSTGNMKGFGCAVTRVSDCLLANTYDGSILTLSPDLESWQLLGRLEPGRFFHRLVALSDSKFAIVGGANMESGVCLEVEVFALEQ